MDNGHGKYYNLKTILIKNIISFVFEILQVY